MAVNWQIVHELAGSNRHMTMTESLTLYYQPLHLTSIIFTILLFLFYLYSDVNIYYLT